MTFSIVARADDGASWGVAVASKFLAVGSVVPAAAAGVGAVATQARVNVAYKGAALAHLAEGATAAVALQRLLDEDDLRDQPAGGDRRRRRAGRQPHRGGVPGVGRRGDRRGVRDPGQHPRGRRGRRGYAVRLRGKRHRRHPLRNGCWRLYAPATQPEATRGVGSPRRFSWCGTRRGSTGVTTSKSSCAWRITPVPSTSWSGCSGLHQQLHVEVPEDERTPDTPELFAEMDARAELSGCGRLQCGSASTTTTASGATAGRATRLVEELREATPDWRA